MNDHRPDRTIPLYVHGPRTYPETPLVRQPTFWLGVGIAVVLAAWLTF